MNIFPPRLSYNIKVDVKFYDVGRQEALQISSFFGQRPRSLFVKSDGLGQAQHSFVFPPRNRGGGEVYPINLISEGALRVLSQMYKDQSVHAKMFSHYVATTHPQSTIFSVSRGSPGSLARAPTAVPSLFTLSFSSANIVPTYGNRRLLDVCW